MPWILQHFLYRVKLASTVECCFIQDIVSKCLYLEVGERNMCHASLPLFLLYYTHVLRSISMCTLCLAVYVFRAYYVRIGTGFVIHVVRFPPLHAVWHSVSAYVFSLLLDALCSRRAALARNRVLIVDIAHCRGAVVNPAPSVNSCQTTIPPNSHIRSQVFYMGK